MIIDYEFFCRIMSLINFFTLQDVLNATTASWFKLNYSKLMNCHVYVIIEKGVLKDTNFSNIIKLFQVSTILFINENFRCRHVINWLPKFAQTLTAERLQCDKMLKMNSWFNQLVFRIITFSQVQSLYKYELLFVYS